MKRLLWVLALTCLLSACGQNSSSAMLWHYAKLKWSNNTGAPAETLVADVGYLQRNKTETTVTWVGHASTFLQVAGLNVLIDPNFSTQLGSLGWLAPKRQQAPGLLISELPPVDVVFISNNQYDRLDEASVRQLAANNQPLFVVPRGIDELLKSWGIAKVTALDAWGKLEVKGVQLQLTPAQTPSWRFRQVAEKNTSGGLLIQTSKFNAYYAGCTGNGDFFNQVVQQFQPQFPVLNLAIFCMGTPESLSAAQLVAAHQQLRAKQTLAVGWGTFALTDKALDEPLRALPAAAKAAGLADSEIVLFKVGETGIWRDPPKPDTRGQTRFNPKRQWRRGEARPM